MEKVRLDVALFKLKLFESREKAKEAIESGIVYVNNKICKKPGEKVKICTFFDDFQCECADKNSLNQLQNNKDVKIKTNTSIISTNISLNNINYTNDDLDKIEIKGERLKFVSRAGLKIEHALTHYDINVCGKTILDVGASTGGFTDCVLQNGAKKVYALDVGYNQLAEKLKLDKRVINIEKTNIKDVKKSDFNDIDMIITDLSFISLTKVSSKFADLLKSGQKIIALIKPQFELGREEIKKCAGVVKEKALQEKAKNIVIADFLSKNFKLLYIDDSPILGTEGNKEYISIFERL